jgi:hypothetical protein
MDKCENLFSQVAREHGFDIKILHQSVAGDFIHSHNEYALKKSISEAAKRIAAVAYMI